MCQRFITAAVLALILSGSTVHAQCGCSSPPVFTSVAPSYSTSYYAPPAAYTPAPSVSYYAPPAAYVAPAPYVSYYAPPVTYEAPTPYVSYYAPPVAYAPAPYVTYYAPPAAYAPVVVRYRAYYAVPGVRLYGTP
jgi:hypothetical protein